MIHLDEPFLFNALMDNMADSIYFKDRHCRLLRVSRKMASVLGYENPADMIEKTDIDLFGKEFGEKTKIDDLNVMKSGEPIIGLVESRHLANGDTNWTSTTKFPLRDENGIVVGLLGITREINELIRTQFDLQHMATHDILTSLPNRDLFFDRLGQAILRASRNKAKFAILYIDLDYFKEINDRFGHDEGDNLLKQLAVILKAHVRASDTVARMGGDEFVVLMDTIQEPEESTVLAQRILDVLNKDYIIPTAHSKITASIGISLFPKHGTDATVLIKAADNAMYQAKIRHNCYCLYTLQKKDK